MWTWAARLAGMTHGAGVQRTRMPLQGVELNGVIRLSAGRDGVGAVVTRLAIDAAMFL